MHQADQGVCAAILIRYGIPVVSQRDFRTLGLVMLKLDDGFALDPEARDHRETDWYVEKLGGGL